LVTATFNPIHTPQKTEKDLKKCIGAKEEDKNKEISQILGGHNVLAMAII
jgi:hypothetical protein